MISVRVFGNREVAKRLAALPEKLQRKIVRKALRKGAATFRTQARANAPLLSGRLARAIKTVGRRTRRDMMREHMQVRLRVAQAGADQVPYGSFQELGAPGHNLPAARFMREAYLQQRMAVLDTIKAEILSGLDSVVKGG